MTINIIQLDYQNEKHGRDLLHCLNAYALDPMGGGEPLSTQVNDNLIAALQKQSHVFSVMAYVDNEPAGLVNCVEGFSTFKAKPIVNIHDAVVLAKFRRQGLTDKMFSFVEQIAKEKGACKLTLEVLEGNTIAQQAYKKFGFAGYELDPKMGKAMFWQKSF